MEFRKLILFFIFIAIFFLPYNGAFPQKPVKATQENAEESSPKQIESKLEVIQTRIAASRDAENEETAQTLGVSLSELAERTNLLREVEALYNRQLTALKNQVALEQEENILKEKIKKGKIVDPTQKPPYSLSRYDDYQSLLTNRLQAIRDAETTIKLSNKSRKNAKQNLKDIEHAIRIIREELQKENEPADLLTLKWELEQTEIEKELAQVAYDYQSFSYQNTLKKLELAKIQADIAKKSVKRIKSHLHFNEADLKEKILNLEKRKEELQLKIKNLLKKQRKAEVAWLGAQKNLDKAKDKETGAIARAALTASELWRQTYQNMLEHYEVMVQLLIQEENIWKRRYALIRDDVDYKEVRKWREEAEKQDQSLNREIHLLQSRQTNLQLQIAKVEDQLSENDLIIGLKQQLQEQHKALRTFAESNFYYLPALNATYQMHKWFLDELSIEQKEFSVWKTFLAVLSKILDIWRFELYVVDEQGITVGKIIVTLIILIGGIILSSRLASIIHHRILSRTPLKESAVAITEKLIYYFAVTLVIIFALRIVNIPLTAFTFLGGAIAIGVGFGAQKLINNFISGFILMAEQPIKVGDLVEIEGALGVIEDIGVRCTRVRSFQSIHTLVPNSYFLEKNITNWTHNNNEVRAQVTVGVIYGSPTREVKRLLLKAVQDHGEILKRPEPFVLFNDFGDNALIFDVYFWVSIGKVMDRRRIESDVRFMIDELFRDKDIVIAFPQRDIHLDTTKPIQCEIVRSEDIEKEQV